MICLTEEESEKLKQNQIEFSQLNEKYTQSMAACNQAAIDALRSNPFIEVNQLKLVEQYSEVFKNQSKVVGEYNSLMIRYNDLSDQHNDLIAVTKGIALILVVTYISLIIKWLIKVERKMSKRDKPKPIKFAKRTNPKKGDRY